MRAYEATAAGHAMPQPLRALADASSEGCKGYSDGYEVRY